MNRHLVALVALSLCTACATAVPHARPSATSGIPEPYRYGFVNAAIQCSPDWGPEPTRVMVFLSDVFGFCPIDAEDPRGLIAGRLASLAHSSCDVAIRVLFVAVDGHDSRVEADAALGERVRQAGENGRQVVSVDFVSALPTGACEAPRAGTSAARL